MSILNNTIKLQNLIDKINALPEAGAELPDLINPATADMLFKDYELIDGEGSKVTGTFTIDNELMEQFSLISELDAKIAELAEILNSKTSGSGDTAIEEWTGTVNVLTGLGSLAMSLYYTDETLTPKMFADGIPIQNKTITIAAGTAIIASGYRELILTNVEDITSENDIMNDVNTVLLPTANNFSISN